MSIYLLLLVIIFISAYISKKNNYCYLIGGIFILVSALRPFSVGVDLSSYYSAFNRYANISFSTLKSIRFEPLFGVLNIIINKLGGDFRVFIIITSIISFWGVMIFVKNHSYLKWFSFLLYFLFGCYFNSLNMVRMYLAGSLVLLGFSFYLKGEKKKAIYMVIIASLFHYTAMASLLFFVFESFDQNYKKVFFLAGTVIFYILFRNQIVNFAIQSYGNAYSTSGATFVSGNGFSLLIVYILLYLFGKIFQKYSLCERKYIKCFDSLMCLAILFQTIALSMSVFTRITFYFITPALLLLPNIVFSYYYDADNYEENSSNSINKISPVFIHTKNNYLWMLMIVILFAFWFFIISRADSNGVLPYAIFDLQL